MGKERAKVRWSSLGKGRSTREKLEEAIAACIFASFLLTLPHPSLSLPFPTFLSHPCNTLARWGDVTATRDRNARDTHIPTTWWTKGVSGEIFAQGESGRRAYLICILLSLWLVPNTAS